MVWVVTKYGKKCLHQVFTLSKYARIAGTQTFFTCFTLSFGVSGGFWLTFCRFPCLVYSSVHCFQEQLVYIQHQSPVITEVTPLIRNLKCQIWLISAKNLPNYRPSLFQRFSTSVPVSNRDSFGFCLTLFKWFGDLWRGDVKGGEMVRASSLSTSSSASLSCFCGPEVPRRSLMSSSGSEWALLIIFWYAAVSVSGTSSSKSSS